MQQPKTEEDVESEEELTFEEIAEHSNDKVDALIELLIKKGVFTEEEYNKEYEDLFEEEESKEASEE